MKTLADIKRRVKVGTRLKCIENTYVPKWDGKVRTVVHVQGNSFAWLEEDKVEEPTPVGSSRSCWTNWPKAKDVKIIDPDTFDLILDVKLSVHANTGKPHHVRLQFLDGEGDVPAHMKPCPKGRGVKGTLHSFNAFEVVGEVERDDRKYDVRKYTCCSCGASYNRECFRLD